MVFVVVFNKNVSYNETKRDEQNARTEENGGACDAD